MKAMSEKKLLGYTFSLLSGICYGSGQVIARWGVSGLASPLFGSTISLFWGVVVLYLVGHKDFASGLRGNRKGLVFVLLSGVLSATGVVFLFKALRMASVAVVAPFQGTAPVFTILGSYIFLKQVERISLRLLFGCVFIVIGSVLVTLGR